MSHKRGPLPRRLICGKKIDLTLELFCSERCRLVDLGQWLGGEYRFSTETSRREEDKVE